MVPVSVAFMNIAHNFEVKTTLHVITLAGMFYVSKCLLSPEAPPVMQLLIYLSIAWRNKSAC